MRRTAIALIVGIALGFAAGHATATSPTATKIDRSDLRPVQVSSQPEAPHRTTLPAPGGVSPLPGTTEAPSLPPSPATPAPSLQEAVPGPTRQSTSALTGTASWYCLSKRSACTVGYPASGMYAAAGPALRVGNWRGRYVTVNGIRVQIIDWCACSAGTSREKVIDLYASAFREVVDPTWWPGKRDAKGQLIPDPLSRGIYAVRVTW